MTMLAYALALALVGDPTPGELPRWNEAPPPREPAKVKVPATGSGLITLGSVLLVSGGGLGISSIIVAAEPELSPTASPAIPGLIATFQLASGTVALVLGLVVRRQFRAKPQIPGAPHTGAAMQIGGLGLMASGTIYSIHGLADMTSAICNDEGCSDIRPIGAPIELGFGLTSVAVGTGLFIAGTQRRVAYRRWAELRPTFTLTRGSLQLGVGGRF